ncbi:MAG: hypothetical protein HQL12_02300 [Candidatus Omnitrophica bacterium]|nr:hypothetical protein [Candidatus Omnitrophota bacterium]
MRKRYLIWGFGLVFISAFAFSALADQSIGYQQYFKEGVKAFHEHDDAKALRCFKIAQIYDPSDEQLNKYIRILEKKAVTFEPSPSELSPEESIGFKYYLSQGIEAFQKHDNKKAAYYFNIAIIFDPDSKEADQYLETLGQSVRQVVIPQAQPLLPLPSQHEEAISQTFPSVQPRQEEVIPQPVPTVPQQQEAVMPSQLLAPVQPQQVRAMPQPPSVKSQGAIYIPASSAKMPITEISLAQISNNGQLNPKLQIAYHSSVIIQGKDIQRFLIVDEGYIGVRIIDNDHLEIDALTIGTTFLHIWDSFGRHSLYVQVVFPKIVSSGSSQEMNGVQHSQPFRATYTNDWDTYYTGKNIPHLKRQNYSFNQTLAVYGETPYGFFDASGSYTDYDAFSEFDTYTIGLSQIPLDGTSNFNLRGFDASRYLSPLTMPTTRLRGVFADVDLLGDTLGLSVSHGQEQTPLGFITLGNQAQFNNSYIDAAKLTLFPKSANDRYSFNFATGHGSDRQPYLTEHVYSVEGQHKFNDFLTLNGEEGYDSSHDASLASLKWQKGTFKTGLNFRNIDKNYSTVSTLPAYQGETGVAWTTDSDFKRFTENTFVEAYKDRLYYNPDSPDTYNYDANGQLRVNITDNFWSDSDFNYLNTSGEASPINSLGFNERISRSFGIWNSFKGIVFGGVGYQNSHSPDSDTSDYSREDVITGIQLPLTSHISSFANYEYDWLHQPHSNGNSNPGVINTGLEYQKQVNSKISFNSQISFHDELAVKPGSNSFLSGEESVIITSGFNYNPVPDVNIFADGNVSKVLSHTGNPSYDDFEVHVGMRITFGGSTYWDPLGTVTGIVFKDRVGNGKFVSGDEGIAGVKVKVGDKVTVTGKDGRYRIQIRAKGADVVPVLDTIPGGLIFSTPQTLNVRVKQGREAKADFGLISQTGIYGLVFVNKNGNGVPNEGDRFIGKVKVILDGKTIQVSDSHGAFYFRKVSPGQHTISIDINTLAINMVPTVKLQNKIDVPEGVNYMFNIPVQIKQAEGEENQ